MFVIISYGILVGIVAAVNPILGGAIGLGLATIGGLMMLIKHTRK
jgi:hypothetical protein